MQRPTPMFQIAHCLPSTPSPLFDDDARGRDDFRELPAQEEEPYDRWQGRKCRAPHGQAVLNARGWF